MRRSEKGPMRWATPSAYVTATYWSSICGASAIRSMATTCPTFRHFARTLKKFLRAPRYEGPWPPKVFKFLRSNSNCSKIQMSKLVLYHYPMSLCSQKVRLCLAELGLSYDPRSVDIGFGVENFEPWYIRLNPAGVVPTLCDGERIVTNSAQILRYLAMRTGEGLPSDARQRDAAAHWLTVADAMPLHAISYSRGAIPRGDELLEKRLDRIVELRKSNRDLKEVYDALYERVSGLRNTAILYKDSGRAVEEL